MSLYVSNYWAFLLLLFIPLVHYIAKRSLSGLSKYRRVLTLSIRYILLILLILALADLHMSIKSKQLTVLFVVDFSKSVPSSTQDKALRFIENSITKMDARVDQFGLLVFGQDASFEYLNEKRKLKISNIQSQILTEQTDIASSLRLAIAALPNTGQRRIVLISDGNETIGNVLKEIEQAVSDGITIDVVPLTFNNEKEVLVEKMIVPNNVNEGQSYEVTVVVTSQTDTEGTLRLFLNGEMVRYIGIDLRKGKNSFNILVPGEWVKLGFQKLKIVLDSKDDSLVANNIVEEFTYVRGIPKILYVENDTANSDYLYSALTTSPDGIPLMKVDRVTSEYIPRDILTLNSYDAIILSNISATEISLEQMQMMESAVHEAGIGLIMIGGENSFGAGGYKNTPIERALPVLMDIKNRKIIPNGALAIVLHTCEFANGNEKGKEISKEAISRLSSEDYAGIIVYDYQNGAGWLIPPTKIVNKGRIISAIDGSNAGDMPDFDPSLKSAYLGLKDLPAMKKHIIIITDGDPSAPGKGLMNQIIQAKISITTIVINPHSPGDGKFMQQIAQYTGGNFYDVTNVKALPSIFIKEALTVKNALIYEENRTPQVRYHTDLIKGINPEEFPPILGCVLTSAKTEPSVSVPLYIMGKDNDKEVLLAHMQYGLGRSVAYTSDAKNRWGKNWLDWDKYNKFWRQTIRWATRQLNKNSFRVNTVVKRGKGQIVIDAIDEKGEYLPFLQMKGSIIKPNGHSQIIELHQEGVGRYTSEFEVGDTGTYLISVVYNDQDGKSQYLTSGLSVSFSSEYLFTSSNSTLMYQIATKTNGRSLEYAFMDSDFDGFLSKEEWKKDSSEFSKLDVDEDGFLGADEYSEQSIFLHDEPRGGQPQPLWSYFLIAFIILFVIDIFIRRVLLDYHKIWEQIIAFSFSRRETKEQTETMSRLMKTKEKVRENLSQHEQGLDLKKFEKIGKSKGGKIPENTGQSSKTGTFESHKEQQKIPPKSIKQQKEEKEKEEVQDYTSRLLAAKKKTWEKKDN